MNNPENPHVPGGCSIAALKLAETFAVTAIIGGTAAVVAPTNEAAWIAAGAGFTIDVFRFLFKRGKEQLAADVGVQTQEQKDANASMARQIAERQKQINSVQNSHDDDPLKRIGL